MKHLSSKFCTQAIAGASLFCLVAQPVSASVFHNGWQYAIDVGYDSLAGDGAGGLNVGGTIYETYGFAIKDDVENNTVWVGINGNLPITGRPIPGNQINGFPVPNGNIGWGDLLFDFVDGTEPDPTNQYIGNFKAANDSSQLFGVRFAANNDSGVATLGLYSNVSGIGVTNINAGWSNLEKHNNEVLTRRGLNAWMGDLRWSDPYYQDYNSLSASINDDPSTHLPSNIGSGTRIADVTLRSQADLEAAGFDPGFFFEQGAEIFGFSFEKPVGFRGDFIATLLTECINDGAALLGRFEPQEPSPPLPPPPPPFDSIDLDQCPITIGQIEALLPDEVDGEWKRFYDVASHKWYDPPAWEGMLIEAGDGTLFTRIDDFPCGIAANDNFSIFITDEILGDILVEKNIGPGNKIIFDQPVSSFKIIWDKSLVNPNADVPFALSMSGTAETMDVGIRPLKPYEIPHIPEPTSVLSLALVGIAGWLSRRWLGQPKD